MANTLTISNTMNWCTAFSLGRVLTPFTGNEPALTSANMLLQTILSPPFSWNWNRNNLTFQTSANIQDYVISTTASATFGWIEKAAWIPSASITNVALTSNVASITANNSFKVGDLVTISGLTTTALNVTNVAITTANSTGFNFALTNSNIPSAGDTGTAIAGKYSEISQIQNVLANGTETGSPNSIAPQNDDNAGNITFRLLPTPKSSYQINIIFQKRIPALVTATSNTWAPIPDHYAYIYDWGFLALMMAYNQDPRWAQANQKFVAGLLGIAEGLSEDQKSAFQNAWLNVLTQVNTTQMKSQQGVQSRGY